MNENEVEIENIIDPEKSYHYVMSKEDLNIIYLPCGNISRQKAEEYCRMVLDKIKLTEDYKILLIPTFSYNILED